MKSRLVNLVNDLDQVIGHADLLDAHRGFGKKHQAVSLFVFHRQSDGDLNLLIQQRSQQKIVGALQWANSLCANLAPDEDHLACVKRRLLEELGVKWQNNWQIEEIGILDYQVACENGYSENEIDHFFVMVLDDKRLLEFKINPNPDEVADFTWLNWADIRAGRVQKYQFAPWFSLFLKQEEIMQKVEVTCRQ